MEPLSPVKILRNYEGVVIVDTNTSEDDQKKLFRNNQDIIKNFGGEVNHLDTWGRRILANPIKKQKSAVYFHTTFTAEPGAVAELERTMKINDSVLRFMFSKLDDRKTIAQHLQEYRDVIAESSKREQEREAKFQKKKAARQARPPRGDKPERA